MRISDWSSDVCSSDLAAQVSCLGELLATVDEQEIGVGSFQQGATLGRKDLHAVAEQREAGQHFGRRLQGAGEEEESAHLDSFQAGPRSEPLGKDIGCEPPERRRSEEHTSELQSLMRNSYAVFCLKTKKHFTTHQPTPPTAY